MKLDTLVLRPRMSEKTYDQSHAENTYAFDVSVDANKVEVANAVAAQYGVTVERVRTFRAKGKVARSIRIGGTRKNVSGKRPDFKKAYVRVKDGENIPIFAKIEEETKKQEKLEEKLAKKAAKDSPKEVSKVPTVKRTPTKPKPIIASEEAKTEDKKPEPEHKFRLRLPFMRKRKGDKE